MERLTKILGVSLALAIYALMFAAILAGIAFFLDTIWG